MIGDDPIDADEIYTLLAERDELRVLLADRITPRLRALGVAVEAIMRQWLADPAQVDPVDIQAVETQLRGHHEWWIQNYGEDPAGGARAQQLALFRRMREQIANGIFPQIADEQLPPRENGSHGADNFPRAGYGKVARDVGDSRAVTAAQARINQNIAANIVRVRMAAGYNGKQFAARLGIAPSRLSDYEHARIRPSDDRLAEIVDLTGALSVGWFYDPHDEDDE